MSASSLEQKTIRPGRLVGYSYYYSNRQPGPPPRPTDKARSKSYVGRGLLIIAVLAALIAVPLLRSNPSTKPAAAKQTTNTAAKTTPAPKSTPTAAAVTPAITNQCAGNSLDQSIKVSISQRHLWACQQSKVVYDSPVITGISTYASTVTPTGTYKIYAKRTDTTLTGSDVTGSWSDPVSYWMPFLNNQYGTYGFHDATWRPDSAFGNIYPSSADASHGCVELPLATAHWLYDWSQIGTTVTITS